MAYTTVTHHSYGSRLMESIKGVAVGALLFIISVPLLFWNEGRAIKTARALTEGSKAVITVKADAVDKANEGKLVALTGVQAQTADVLKDPEFGVSANAIHLARDVEMYQWKENKEEKTVKNVGGSSDTITTYTYAKEWASDHIDSSDFHDPSHPDNPPRMPWKSDSWYAQNVSVGAFKLPPKLIEEVGGEQTLPMAQEQLAALPPSLGGSGSAEKAPAHEAAPTPAPKKGAKKAPAKKPAPKVAKAAKTTPAKSSGGGGRVKLADGGFYLGANPSEPSIGDIKVHYQVVKPTAVSLVARQSGDSFSGWTSSNGRELEFLYTGAKSAQEMFQAEQTSNAILTWVLRFVGWLAMVIGLGMIGKPFSVMADVIPLFGNMLGMGIALFAFVVGSAFSTIVVAIGWVFYRPLLGIPLLLLAVGAMVGIHFLGAGKKKAAAGAGAAGGMDPPMPAPTQ